MSPFLLNPFLGSAGGGAGGFSWKRTLTIDHTQAGSSDTSNFRLLVSFTDATLKTTGNGGHVTNSSGFDIGYYSDSALTTKLDWETELYVASTGQVIAWVRVPTLSHSADTVIYQAYGNSSITTDQSNKTGVWGANAKSVLHLPDGSSLSAADSSIANATWTATGSPVAGTGTIDGGMSASSSSQYLKGPATPNGTDPMTVRLWFKPANITTFAAISSSNDTDTTHPGYLIQLNNANLKIYVDGGYQETSQNLTAGTWYLIGITLSVSGPTYTWKFYSNGSLLSTHTGGGSFYGVGAAMLGYGYPNATSPGVYDEYRLIQETASSDRMLAEYNNENSPSGFVTVGTETSA